MRYTIITYLNCCARGAVDLGDKTWDDVENYYVKWDTLSVKFKGEQEWKQYVLDSDVYDGIDWEHPSSVEVYTEDGDSIEVLG